MRTFLSLGAGVDTTAILRIPELVAQMDFVMFADTGGEHPETYEYIKNWIAPFLEEKKIPFIIVRGKENADGVEVENMEEAYLRWKIIPVRFLRHCTHRWKIRPMAKYVKETYPDEEVRAIIGFAFDEAERMNNEVWKDYTPWYPLVDKKITRDMCEKIIKDSGWPIPPKSGCFYCPFQRIDGWKELRYRHRDLWQRAINLEKNGAAYPDLTLSNFKKNKVPLTLEEVDRRLGRTLDEFDEDVEDPECGGACMT